MATGDEKVNLELKRFLSANRLDANFLEYLRKASRDNLKELLPNEGLFTYPVTITINGTSGTPSDFDLSVSPAGDIEGTDGLGNIIVLALADQTGIDFEHASGERYWIGLKHIEIPTGLYINPRTGLPEYDKIEEAIGELDEPTSVTDNGANLTFNVNSIFESSVDHTGRTVRVWLKNPLTSDPAVAFEDVQVVYSATDNEITTTGLLGQTTPASVVASDYQVAAIGPTVRKSASNPFNLSGPEYIIIGNILDATAVDQAEQRDYRGGGGHTLQKAYDGAGSGSGRIIVADDEAVEIQQSNATLREHDSFQSALRVVKDGDGAQVSGPPFVPRDMEIGVDVKMRNFSQYGGVIARANLIDQAGTKIQKDEPVEITVASTLNFTRGGALDLLMTGRNGGIAPSFDVVEISDSVNGNDGVYIVGTPTVNTCTLFEIDGTTPASLTNETGTSMKANFYRLLAQVGKGGAGLFCVSAADFMRDASFPEGGITLLAPSGMAAASRILNIATTSLSDLFYVDRIGNVVSAGDITAGSDLFATQHCHVPSNRNFKHTTTRTGVWKVIPLEDGLQDASSAWTLATRKSIANWVAGTPSGGGVDVVSFPIRCPHGSTLQAVEAVVQAASTGTPISIDVIHRSNDIFATPGFPARVSLGNALSTTQGPAWENVAITGIGQLIDNITNEYIVAVESFANGDAVVGVRFQFDYDNFEMH